MTALELATMIDNFRVTVGDNRLLTPEERKLLVAALAARSEKGTLTGETPRVDALAAEYLKGAGQPNLPPSAMQDDIWTLARELERALKANRGPSPRQEEDFW